jgi:hypothetical protein
MRFLPEGLSFCAVCDEIRGTTPTGRLSVGHCQGVTRRRIGAWTLSL